MRKIIEPLLLAMVLVFGLTLLNSTPAEAGQCSAGGFYCGTIKHYAPDSGIDSPIKIRCDYGKPSTNALVYEGESSKKYCRDTDQVYNRSGQAIWCKYATTSVTTNWREVFHGTGWYKINDLFNGGIGCTIRKRK